MTEFQRLFLIQGRTDFAVFQLLRGQAEFPACHPLHYLQMSTELLGKAHAWKNGSPKKTHRALVGFLKSLSTNRQAQQQLGYAKRNENWSHLIRKSISIAEQIEDLAPALAHNGPNPEYPWPDVAPQFAPAEFNFPLWAELQTAGGRQFMKLIDNLFDVAEAYL